MDAVRNKTPWIKLFNMRAMPLLLLFLAAGVFCVSMGYIWAAVALVAFSGLAVFLFCSKSVSKSLFIASVVLLMFGYLWGCGSLHIYNNTGLSGEVTLTCTVKNTEKSGNGYTVTCRNVKCGGKSYSDYITFYSENDYSVGDKLRISGSASANKFDFSDKFCGLNYRKKLKYTLNAKTVEVTGGGKTVAERVRADAFSVLEKAEGKEIAGVSYAMLFGDDKYLNYADKAALRAVGVAHIFAVSGLHVSVLAGILLFVLKRTKMRERYKIFVVLPVLLFYAWLADFTSSVVRAVVMWATYMAAKSLGRCGDSLSVWSFAAFGMLFVKPLLLFDVSFVMSFGAVFGIMCLYEPIAKFFNRHHFKGKAASAVALSSATAVSTFPISCFYFGGASLVSVPANFFVVPIMTCVYVFTVVLVPFCALFGISKPLALLCYPVKFVTAVCKKVADMGLYASYSASIAEAIIAYCTIFFVGKYSLARKWVKCGVAAVGVCLMCLALI